MPRIKKSDHVLKTVRKSARLNLELDEGQHLELEDEAVVEGKDGNGASIEKKRSEAGVSPTVAADGVGGTVLALEGGVPEGGNSVPPTQPRPKNVATPEEVQTFCNRFSRSSEEHRNGEKGLPGLKGRAACGESLQNTKKRQLALEASRMTPIKKLFKRQTRRAARAQDLAPPPLGDLAAPGGAGVPEVGDKQTPPETESEAEAPN